MEIKSAKNCFFVGEDEKSPQGLIKYIEEEEGVLLVTSTQVNPSMRGQGLAGILLDHLADYARSEDLKLRAQCSYVVKKFDQDPSYNDINADR